MQESRNKNVDDIVSKRMEKLSVEDAIGAFFPYDSPYSDQQTGIENAITALYSNNFHLIEGACGTGKTLISLTAAMAAIRNPDTKYKRALVATSVKQQQKAFEGDIETINESILDEYGDRRRAPEGKKPIDSLTIVGKQDLCPYVDSGAIDKQDISTECSQLKQNTYETSMRISAHDNHVSDGANKIIQSGKLTEKDSQSKRAQRVRGDPTHNMVDNPAFQPHPVAQYDNTVCPYYAQALIDDEKDQQTMSYDGMMDANTLRSQAAQLGTCPYEVMREGIKRGEIIIGNYAHVFDETTVQATTQSIIDDETILIVDEAHMLIERARDQLTKTVSRSELSQAIEAIDMFIQNKNKLTSQTKEKVEKDLRHAQTSISEMKMYKNLFKDMIGFIDSLSNVYCERQHNDPDERLTESEVIALKNPESTQTGQLMNWLESQPYTDELYEDAKYKLQAISNAISETITDVGSIGSGINPNTVKTAGDYISKKFYADEVDYVTKIQLTQEREDRSIDYMGVDTYSDIYAAELQTQNCMPAYDLATQFSKFGAGIIMSATLSPVEVTSEIIGLDLLDTGYTSDVFGLSFPEENRESYILPLDKYTSSNRGSPANNNSVRQKYKQAVENIVTTTRGNTLICMPKYAEAKWIGEYLDSKLSIPIYIDESSSNDETNQLRTNFINEQKAVLTTSLRGTLTEGVDYDGNDLSNVIVVGIPLTDPTSYRSKAIRNTYTLKFGSSSAFDYSFTLPAIFKTRQALGRVIRSADDTGMRFLLDERYGDGRTASKFLTEQQQTEYTQINMTELKNEIRTFWNNRNTKK